jgi:signal transduction histidine kinase
MSTMYRVSIPGLAADIRWAGGVVSWPQDAGGMGLRLALSRAIIAAHRGWIWATRNPDRGSRCRSP